MKIAVIGASGAMGSRISSRLHQNGLEVIAASKATGIDVLTGDGLASALKGCDALIDVTNSGAFGESDPLGFFKRTGRNLLDAAKAAGIRHYAVLSVVGTDRLVENDYFRAKLVQENLVRSSGLAYTVVRSTQFFEFFSGILDSAANDGKLQLPALRLRPVSADEAADHITSIVCSAPKNAIVELGGPETIELVDLARELLTATDDSRPIGLDRQARYFGVAVSSEGLLPAKAAITGRLSFHDWLSQTIAA